MALKSVLINLKSDTSFLSDIKAIGGLYEQSCESGTKHAIAGTAFLKIYA